MQYIKLSIAAIMFAVLGCFVPSLLRQKNISVGQGGFAAPGWIRVANVFKNALSTGVERGGQFAVYHRGKLVVQFTGGFADEEAKWCLTDDTLIQIFSSTKGFGALVIAKLVEKGLLDYKSPVAKYWPDFAQNGKENITLEHLLSHQAGLPYTDEQFSLLDLNFNSEKVGRILAQQKPIWEPGTKIAYHGFTIGFYEDQIVRKVDIQKRSLSQFFHEEIAVPFGVDAFIGLPEYENYRCARNHEPDSLHHIFDAYKYWPAYWQYLTNSSSVVAKELANIEDLKDTHFNNPKYRAVISPSGGGFSTAVALARFYGILANGGVLDGKTLLSENLIRQLREPLAVGFDECFSFDIIYGRGVTLFKTPTGGYMFGAPGAGGQMAYSDPEHQLGWAYLTNYMSLNDIGDDPRYKALEKAMYEAVIEIERKEQRP